MDRSSQAPLTEGTDRSVVRAILAIADSLHLDVVADGIERSAERAALVSLECRFGRGYLFAPALTAAAAMRLLVGERGLPKSP